jgi:hypothetical protein
MFQTLVDIYQHRWRSKTAKYVVQRNLDDQSFLDYFL